MKTDEVPQDTARTYGGTRKILYAVDDGGAYSAVHSAGWEVETYATMSAVDLWDDLRRTAWLKAQSGTASPLEFHMLSRRMDLATLAAATGIWRWRIRRHFRPSVFAALPIGVLHKYGAALNLTPQDLQALPPSLEA